MKSVPFWCRLCVIVSLSFSLRPRPSHLKCQCQPLLPPRCRPLRQPQCPARCRCKSRWSLSLPKPTRARIKLSFNGFVANPGRRDSNSAEGQNHLVSVGANGDSGRLGFSFDASRLNAVASATEAASPSSVAQRPTWRTRSSSGFATPTSLAPRTTTPYCLVRLTHWSANWVGPNLFNNDWLFAQGNAYDRMPQLRVAHDDGKIYVAAAAVPNLYGAPVAVPHFQARLGAHLGKAVRRYSWSL